MTVKPCVFEIFVNTSRFIALTKIRFLFINKKKALENTDGKKRIRGYTVDLVTVPSN